MEVHDRVSDWRGSRVVASGALPAFLLSLLHVLATLVVNSPREKASVSDHSGPPSINWPLSGVPAATGDNRLPKAHVAEALEAAAEKYECICLLESLDRPSRRRPPQLVDAATPRP